MVPKENDVSEISLTDNDGINIFFIIANTVVVSRKAMTHSIN
jgi:hypothetical protein